MTTGLVRAAALGLLGLAAWYHLRGYYLLVLDDHSAWDLWLRWLEQACVFAGVSPYRVAEGPQPGCPLPSRFLQFVNYPPWAYFTGLFVLWPPLWATRILFAILDLVGTALVVTEVWKWSRPAGREIAWLLVAAVLAVSAYFDTLAVGQYGIVVLGLLVGVRRLLERGRFALGGVLLGVAMLKPTFAGPFVVPLLVARRWRALAGLGLYLGGASAVTWALTGSDPATMLREMVRYGGAWLGNSYGPINLALAAGFSPEACVALTATAGLALGLGCHLWGRERSHVYHFGVAAVIARVWTFHNVYDNVVLVPALVALMCLWLAVRSATAAAVAGVFALSLWLPAWMVVDAARFAPARGLQIAQVLVWLGGLAYLVAAWPRGAGTER